MRVRTVVSAILAATVCMLALWLQYYKIGPAAFVPGWPAVDLAAIPPSWISIAILFFCGTTLFLFGWVAARWNWADSWQSSLQVGAAAGALAGCLIFDLIGVFWFGIKGQADILRNTYQPLSEAEGTRILVDAIVSTGTLMYINFILVVLVCALLGGLGAIASALVNRTEFWGSDPRNPEGWLFRLPAYNLTLFGYVNLLVALAVFNLLVDRTLNTAVTLAQQHDVQMDIELSSRLFLLFSSLAAWLFAFIPAGITWGWILRTWTVRKKPDGLSLLWIFVTTVGFSCVIFFLDPAVFSRPADLLSMLLGALIGIGIGYKSNQRAEGFPYRFSDWIGYGLTYGILGGTQIVMSAMAYGFAIALIAIPNIPHLTASGSVEKNPVEQVAFLFTMQTTSATGAVLVSMIIGVAIAGFVSFLRAVFGIRDVSMLEE